MLKLTRTHVWASTLACLAIAVAASGAFAQQQEEQDQAKHDQSQQHDQQSDEAQRYEAQKPSDEESRRQDQQRGRSDQERARQEQQRTQQQRERDQQSRFPSPNRDTYGRDQEQWNRDREQHSRDRDQASRERDQFSRDSQRRGRGGDEGGLGVSIARDGRGEGISVIRVHRNSPAEQMGLQEGDRITHLNGRQVQSSEEFISRIRNMDPGQQVEIDVLRDRDQRSFRGELESRQEALVLRGAPRGQSWYQESRGTRQTGYEEGGRFVQGQSGRSGEVERQLSQIERQLSQLSREIEDLRYAVRDVRQQSSRGGRETTAGYQEDRGPRDARMTERWEEDRQYDGGRQNQRSREYGSERGFDTSGQQSRQYDQGGIRSGQYDSDRGESIGGDTGQSRLRPDAE